MQVIGRIATIASKSWRSTEKFISHKVEIATLNYVYSQTNVAMMAALFCASIVFIGLYSNKFISSALYGWAAFFVAVVIFRLLNTYLYFYKRSTPTDVKLWRRLYILGSLLGGASWGLAGIYLFPHATPIQKILIILMDAGVTAGAVPFSAAIPLAAIMFLTFAVMPFIITIALLEDKTYWLFDIALSLYYVYNIILTIKAHKLINDSIRLQFENEGLVIDLEKTNRKLESAATHDPLTQLANRTLFVSTLDDAIKRARAKNAILALFYLDLDNFKPANDRYGHEAGDKILLQVTERLKNYFRKEDIIARLGGDEIAIIIENATNRREIETIAHKICNLVSQPIKYGDITINVSASIGISVYPYDGKNEEALLRSSDKCMYAVKKHGGNSFRFSTESGEQLSSG